MIKITIAIVLVLCGVAAGQTRSFTPVEGANLKAKIENAIIAGKANAPGGRFWVGYQFEVRPGVAVDFEIVDSGGGVYISTDGTSMMFDPRHETRELGLFLLYDTQRDSFTRAEVYNLRRDHEFSSYPVYWAGHITNEESLNYLKSIVDSPAPEINRRQGSNANNSARMYRPGEPPKLCKWVEQSEHRHRGRRYSFADRCPKRNISAINVLAAIRSGPVNSARNSL